MVTSFVRSFAEAVFAAFLILLCLHVSSAQVMQSSNYQIQSDSLNVGGVFASSSNYVLESTVGEVGTGASDSGTYALRAGFQQMQSIYIALSGATDIVLENSLPGITGGSSNGSTTVTVITDSPSGYALTIQSENAPAMQKGADSIADYAPGDDPSLNFSANPGEAYFGFSPEGADIVARFKDNGATCGTGGSLDTPLSCWDGLSTEGETISQSTNPNHPDGTTTTVRFRVSIGEGVNQAPGMYVATTTITALPL